jgi:hypothetical protein
VVSHYIANPLTIDGLKFDLRIYVAITSINPLRIYIYEEGLVRFATQLYQPPLIDSEADPYVHLTNYSINKHNNKCLIAGHEMAEEADGIKWSFKAWKQVLKAHQVNDEKLFSKIKDIVVKTIISCEPNLNSAFEMYVPHRSNCF